MSNNEPGNPDTPPTGRHDHGPSEHHVCDTALVNAIDQYLKQHGLSDPSVVLTDVLLVASHRGFSAEGTKTATSVVCPTESSVATLLGLTQYASIYYGNTAARSMGSGA